MSIDRYLEDMNRIESIIQPKLKENYVMGPVLNTIWYYPNETEFWITTANIYTDYYDLEPIFLQVWDPLASQVDPCPMQQYEYKFLLYHAGAPVIYEMGYIELDEGEAIYNLIYNGGGVYTITLFSPEIDKINLLSEDTIPGDIFWELDDIPQLGSAFLTFSYEYDGEVWEAYLELYKYSSSGSRENYSMPIASLLDENEILLFDSSEHQDKIDIINYKLHINDVWLQNIELYSNSNGTLTIKYAASGFSMGINPSLHRRSRWPS